MLEITCPEWRERPLYWAAIAYTRAWWATDGVRVAVIRKHGMQPEMLRSLGAEYNVNRSIKRHDKTKGAEDEFAIAVCAVLDEARANWPAGLLGRAKACEEIATKLRPYTGEREKTLVSAATKFMWFLEPDGWTVFDRFAGAGMQVPGHRPRVEQMHAFYGHLHAAGFTTLVAKMQRVVKETPLSNVPPARILDTLFMARGGRGGDASSLEGLGAFLTVLPNTTREALETLAGKLQDRFGDHALAGPTPPNVPRKIKAHA